MTSAAGTEPDSCQSTDLPLRTCSACGLIQRLPVSKEATEWQHAGTSATGRRQGRKPFALQGLPSRRKRICCARCHATLLARPRLLRGNSRAAALAATALVLYPFAIAMPMLEVQSFGHVREASILDGIATLFSTGHLLVGLVILACSVIFPAGKLTAVLALAAGGHRLASRHRAATYRLIEWTGRWGMLDVVLVAVLVATVKLGELADVSPGPAAWTFAACVALNLLAAACFDPHRLWDSGPHHAPCIIGGPGAQTSTRR